MKYIYGERCSGKTMACFALARKEKAYLIVKNKKVLRIMAEMEGYSDIIQRIISYEDYLELKRIGAIRDKKIVIDEAGSLLKEIFGKNLVGYSENIRDLPLENYVFLENLLAPDHLEEFYNNEKIVFKPYDEWEF